MPSKKKASETAQTTVFTFSKGQTDLSFVRVSEEVTNMGDSLTFNMDSATYNADKGCLTIFNGEGLALGVHRNHSTEMMAAAEENGWKLGETDGDRFGPAFENAGLLRGYTHANEEEVWVNIAHAINANDSELTVTMVETKSGGSYRRWSCNKV